MELGLDSKTADISYQDGIVSFSKCKKLTSWSCPCWSLDALIKIAHKNVGQNYISITAHTTISLTLQWDCDNVYYAIGCKTMFEAYLTLVCYMLKQGYIKKEGVK